ncbi:reverse transcriptase domain-containing protein [Tanacetum coccineum]
MASNEETNAAGTDTRPPMYIRGKPLGKLIWNSIQNGPSPHPMITDAPTEDQTGVNMPRLKLDSEFTPEETNRENADTQAEIILSQGLPRHIFNILNQTNTAKEIWDNVEMLMQGEYVAKEDNMIQYLDKTKSLIQGFDRFTIRQVPRGDNKKADALSKIASTSFAHLSKQVLVEILKNKSISEMEISTVIEEQDPTWMTPIIEFISKGTLPHDQKDARRIRRTAQRFELRNGVLYRRSFLQPWLRCVGPIQADYVLREIHAGSCSMHSGPRSVVARALRACRRHRKAVDRKRGRTLRGYGSTLEKGAYNLRDKEGREVSPARGIAAISRKAIIMGISHWV